MAQHFWPLILFSICFTSRVVTADPSTVGYSLESNAYRDFLFAHGVARTPQMGWNSWNHFQCNINETMIKTTADAIVKSGLAALGYRYVNLDDCWADWNRDWKGRLRAKPSTFPSGIKALADYVHSKGLKLGIYSDAGFRTCSQQMPGSLGYEEIDGQTFAEWGVDYLKYDNCYPDNPLPQARYFKMSKALQKAGRPILFSLCEWGQYDPARWASSVGNSWRTTGDINDSFISIMSNADTNNYWGRFAGPGHWNDPDMLEVGNGGQSFEEYKSHFSIWALMKAPLLIGCDVISPSKETLTILMNKEVINVNQDPMGVQGRKLRSVNGLEVWAGPLSNARRAVVLWNRNARTAPITVLWRDVGINPSTPVEVRDLWTHSVVSKKQQDRWTATVDSHACKMYILTPSS